MIRYLWRVAKAKVKSKLSRRRKRTKKEPKTIKLEKVKVCCPKCRRRTDAYREWIVDSRMISHQRDFIGCKWCNRKFLFKDLGEWKK